MSKARELAELSRTVSDSADAVAITIDSTEKVSFANGIDVTGGITATGDLTLSSAGPGITLTDTDNNPDYQIKNGNGSFRIIDTTNSVDRININSSAHVGINNNSPEYALDVDDDTGNAYIAINRATQSQGEVGLKLDGGTSGGDWFIYQKTGGDDLHFYRGADLLTIKTDGKVGIGTTTPQAPFAIRVATSGTAASTIAPALDAGIYLENNASPTNNFIVVKTHNPGNGNVVGGVRFACSPDGQNYNFAAIQGHTSTAGKVGSLRFFTPAGNTSADTSTERMRLQDDDLIVGDTGVIRGNSQTGVSIESEGRIYMSRGTGTGGFSHLAFYNGNGLVGTVQTSGSATSYNTSSDERLKENIVDAPSASADVDAIQVRSFDWKVDGSHQKYGLVAQELKAVAPEAVSDPEDPDEMLGVDYSKLVPMLVKEISIATRSRGTT